MSLLALINYSGLGTSDLAYKPPRFNQFYSLDQVSLTDRTSLHSRHSDQESAAISDVFINCLF
jgi:hypothetical protein